jgi:hypothetical protein
MVHPLLSVAEYEIATPAKERRYVDGVTFLLLESSALG